MTQVWQQVKQAAGAMLRWLNPGEVEMQDTVETVEQMNQLEQDGVQPVETETEAAPAAPAAARPVKETQPWDVRYAAGVDRIRAVKTEISAATGEADGARKGVVEAEASLKMAVAHQGAAMERISDTKLAGVAAIDNQIAILEELKASLSA